MKKVLNWTKKCLESFTFLESVVSLNVPAVVKSFVAAEDLLINQKTPLTKLLGQMLMSICSPIWTHSRVLINEIDNLAHWYYLRAYEDVRSNVLPPTLLHSLLHDFFRITPSHNSNIGM